MGKIKLQMGQVKSMGGELQEEVAASCCSLMDGLFGTRRSHCGAAIADAAEPVAGFKAVAKHVAVCSGTTYPEAGRHAL